ncbi:MAG TPA: hypothetical protein VJA47_05735 [archaeon]|nr:hypothetical protein [archaeon]
MYKKLADIVLKEVNPPDYKVSLTLDDMSEVLVQRLGLQRKVSRANHAKLLRFLLHAKKNNTPLTIETLAKVMEVSVSQSYEEIRKWRTLGLLEFVKVPVQGVSDQYMKGYTLAASTANQLIDKAQIHINAHVRRSKRIAKDFDDQIAAEIARQAKQ